MAPSRSSSKVRTPFEGDEIYDISQFRSPIAGFFITNYAFTGEAFLKAVRECRGMERVKMDLDDLWLQIQFFHDSMLRTQPNSVTDDPEKLAQAVDLILDVSFWRLAVELDQNLKEDLVRDKMMLLQRRLRRMELMLRKTLNTCGEPPKVLGGCIVGVKRPKHKDRLWTRIFGSDPEQKRNEDRSFTVRDVAGLLRLEDFLTFVSKEFDRQIGSKRENPEAGDVQSSVAHFDDEVKSFFKKKDFRTAKELKAQWATILLNPGFRAAVTRETDALVKEAVAFRKKNGYAAHRENCELWGVRPQGGIARALSGLSNKKVEDGKSSRGDTLKPKPKPAFWRTESLSSKKSSKK